MAIPFVTQQGNAYYNDCGWAACEMLLRGVPIPTNLATGFAHWKVVIDPDHSGTNTPDLARYIRYRGGTPDTTSIDYPCVVFVSNYQKIPAANRAPGYTAGTFGHWIVGLSPDRYNDPLHTTARTGQNLQWVGMASATVKSITVQELFMATGAFARVQYDRQFLIAWRGDGRWSQYPSSTREQRQLLEEKRDTTGATLGDSFDDAGLKVITSAGAQGKVVVQLWGWPNDAAVRKAYADFYAIAEYVGAVVEFHDWTELAPVPPPSGIQIAFTAAPGTIEKSQQSTLAWNVVGNVKAIYIDNEGVAGNTGTKVVSPTTTHTYTLRVVPLTGPDVTKATTVTVNAPTGPTVAMGANTLYTGAATRDAIAAGAGAVVMVDNIGDVAQVKIDYPGVRVVCRRTWSTNFMPSSDWLMDQLGVQFIHDQLKAAGKGGLEIVFVGLNENDAIGWDAETIPKRLAFDLEMAYKIKAINPAFKYAASVYAPACNEPSEAWMADMLKTTYAPKYNDGTFYVDQHVYTQRRELMRTNDAGEYEHQWYETRSAFLFKCCGFDPNVRGLIASECGMLGPDRFNAGNWTHQQVTQWWIDYMALTAREVPQMLFECAWQWGDSIPGIGRPSTDWAADELAGQWRGAMVRAFASVNKGAPAPPVDPTLPPKPAIARPPSQGAHKHVILSTQDPEANEWLRLDFFNLQGFPNIMPRVHGMQNCVTGIGGSWVVEAVDEGAVKYAWVLFREKGGYAIKINGTSADPAYSDDKAIKVGCVDSPTVPPPKPPNPTPGTLATAAQLLGMHCMVNVAAAGESIANGARAITLMNQPGAARGLANDPSLIVFHRRYWRDYLPPVDDYMRWHEIDPNGVDTGARFVVLGCNENDQCGSDPAAIKRRAEWDRANFEKLKQCAPNARYAGAGYSHGTPDFGNAAVCDAIRTYYAPLYNGGMLYNQHNYTFRDFEGPEAVSPIWFERSWEFLFEKCGFDPSVRGIVSDETGVEGGACGGMAGCGWTDEKVARWCDHYVNVQRQPYQGKMSPFIASTIYQHGGNGDPQWDRYEMANYMDVLHAAYSKPLPSMHTGEED